MLFSTPDARASYFQDLRDGLAIPFIGDALRHARGTNIGVWGDVGLLETDCLRVLAHEITQVAKEQMPWAQLPSIDELVDRVRHTSSWRVAFTHARHGPDQLLEDFVASLSKSVAPVLPAPDGAPSLDHDVAGEVLVELGLN